MDALCDKTAIRCLAPSAEPSESSLGSTIPAGRDRRAHPYTMRRTGEAALDTEEIRRRLLVPIRAPASRDQRDSGAVKRT